MVDPVPPLERKYDHCLVLGGLVRACITRPKYAALLRDEGVTFGSVVGLGGFRPLRGDERALASRLRLEVDNEFGAMDAGIRRAFKILAEPEVDEGDGSSGNGDWRVHAYPLAQCSVVAAPSSDPVNRRANTADTFGWWARKVGDLRESRVLLITNPIYVPYQGAAAIQMLGLRYGADVEVVGVSAEAADLGPDTQEFKAFHYLQEVRSAVRGWRAVYDESLSL